MHARSTTSAHQSTVSPIAEPAAQRDRMADAMVRVPRPEKEHFGT